MPHTISIKVRGYHLDLFGHVNNARYLEFLEEGRWALLEDRMDVAGFMASGMSLVVVNININYRHPATAGDELQIDTQLRSTGNRSVVVHQVVTLAGSMQVVADADVTFVVVDTATGRAVPLQGEVGSAIGSLRD